MLDQAVSEMKEDLVKMRQASAEVMSTQKMLESKYSQAQASAVSYFCHCCTSGLSSGFVSTQLDACGPKAEDLLVPVAQWSLSDSCMCVEFASCTPRPDLYAKQMQLGKQLRMRLSSSSCSLGTPVWNTACLWHAAQLASLLHPPYKGAEAVSSLSYMPTCAATMSMHH